MDLLYKWDFIQDCIPSEKPAKLRRRFIEEWCSGNYTKEEMIERYRMSERTFRDTIPNGSYFLNNILSLSLFYYPNLFLLQSFLSHCNQNLRPDV